MPHGEKVRFFVTADASAGCPAWQQDVGGCMALSRNALGNLANRYRAVLKKCRLINTFGALLLAGSCVFITPNDTMAVDYTIDKDREWHEFTFQEFNNRARVIHGGDSLTILNEATVSFDFEKGHQGGSIPIGSVGSVIYGDGNISINGGNITSIADPVPESYAISLYNNNPTVKIEDTNLSLKKFDIGIYADQGNLTIANQNTEIRTRNSAEDIGIYASYNAKVYIKTENITLESENIIYSDHNASVNIASSQSSNLHGKIIADGNSHIICDFSKKSVWTGSSNKYKSATIDMTLDGPWNMTGSSSLSTLTLNENVTVDLSYNNAGTTSGFRTLCVEKLNGTGSLFKVNTDIDADKSDQIIITQGEGIHRISVTPTGKEPSREAMDTFIVRQNGGTASFSLANPGGKVDAGLYLYELADRNMTDNPGGKEWYLQRSAGGEKSPTGETVLGLSGMASAYAMYMGQLSDLRERLGEIRHGTGTDGLWVRGFTQENTLSGLGGIDFSQNFYGTSFGYDRLVEQNENNKWLFGVRGQLTKADQRIDGLHDGSGDSRSYGLAAYATWQHGDGWYADTVLSWDWYDQNLKTRMLDGTRVHGSYNTYAGGISQEFGRLFRFGEGFFIEPQLQLSWYWMKGTDFTTSNGMKVEQDDAYALTGRAGLVLGKKWDLDEGRYFQPYIKGGVNHEFAGDQKVLVNGIEFSDDLRGTRGYYGAGFDLQFASNARLYAEFEREDGQKASTPWSVSAGLRVEF